MCPRIFGIFYSQIQDLYVVCCALQLTTVQARKVAKSPRELDHKFLLPAIAPTRLGDLS
ncbi:MAG: hypothetical protein HC916_21155 [Coleofasciculaceae cyanobacterium SM2_1_6]|nr:hypothetical protein [Coleofasciculaceae cyanobacterium SM2_1_6]